MNPEGTDLAPAAPVGGLAAELPAGVRVIPLTKHNDPRGEVTELFREEWGECEPLQWTLLCSQAGALRGVHVHRLRIDYITMAQGRMQLGLHDLRRDSPTFRKSCVLEHSAAQMQAVIVPIGVAHGFYYLEPSVQIIGVTHYWDPSDELGCHWSDPDLAFEWDARAPILSERDRNAPSLAELLRILEQDRRV